MDYSGAYVGQSELPIPHFILWGFVDFLHLNFAKVPFLVGDSLRK